MLDYFLTDEHKMIRDMARTIADEVVRPVAAEYDRNGVFPWPVVEKMAEAGLFGVYIGEEYGGIGDADRTMNMVLVTEEVSKACGGIALSFAGTALGTLPIIIAGNEEQKARLLDWLDGWSLCLSEVNYLKTGYRTEGLLDVHIVTDEDIKNRSSYAVKIGAVTDAAYELPMTAG